jgi:hypothetical protein
MGNSRFRHLDPWSTTVVLLTFVLFLIALFEKGFTRDILLETGIFLVSLKLIVMAHRNSTLAETLDERLARIQESLGRIEDRSSAN